MSELYCVVALLMMLKLQQDDPRILVYGYNSFKSIVK